MATNEPGGRNPSPPGRPSAGSGERMDRPKEGAPLTLGDPHHPLNFLTSPQGVTEASRVVHEPYKLKPHISERVDDLTEQEYIYTLTVPYVWLRGRPKLLRLRLLWFLIKFAFKAAASDHYA